MLDTPKYYGIDLGNRPSMIAPAMNIPPSASNFTSLFSANLIIKELN